MPRRNHVRQECHLVEARVGDIVCGVEAHHGLDERPGAEGAGLEGRDGGVWREGGGGTQEGEALGERVEGVEARGVGEGCVGLDGVAEGEDGDLGGC